MKIINIFISIIAVLLFLFILFYGVFIIPFFTTIFERESFSDIQQAKICDKFKFELASSETIKTRYFSGFLQATTSLTVTINNIESKDNFLERVHLKIPSTNHFSDDEDAIYFDDFLYDSEQQYIKDYRCSLRFVQDNDNLSAEIYVSGYIPQFLDIYDFLYEPWQAYLSNKTFITLVIIEICLILFLLVQIPVFIVKKRGRKQSADNNFV